VETIGGTLRGAKPQDLEALLNEAALGGWEPTIAMPQGANSNRYLVILRREAKERPRDRSWSWPQG
jgi:hypothetical protein